MSSRKTELLLGILRMLERATQPVGYQGKLQSRTVVEFAGDRKKLINHLWTLYDNLSTE